MKVAMISEHASPLAVLGGVDSGGQNVYVAQLAKHLAEMGHQVDVFTRCDSEELPEIVEWQDGVRVIQVPAGPKRYVKKEKLLSLMNTFTKEVLRFMKLEVEPYHLVHAHFFMSALVASKIKKSLGLPYVVTFHALGKVRLQHQGKADQFPPARIGIEELIVQDADHIIAECPQDKQDLIELYQADPAKISIIACGFDNEEFYPVDRWLACKVLGLDPAWRYLLQVGRMVPRKGIDTVIQGFALYLEQNPISQFHLLIVGGESDHPDPVLTPEIGRLQQLANTLNLADRVTFTGRKTRDVLKYYYSAADVFTSTPWYEPFGLTPLEAMATGTPVIGSRVGGISFSVEDGKTGILVPPKDPESFRQALANIMEDPLTRVSMGERSLKRVNTYFTWEHITKQIEQCYQEVVRRSLPNAKRRQNVEESILSNFDTLIHTLIEAKQQLYAPIILAIDAINRTLDVGGKVLVCGNGGSAAEAQHFVAELVGKFQIEGRRALAALALNTDTSILTAWSNDYDFSQVFSRQVAAVGVAGDVLMVMSTSGNSPNIVQAMRVAREKHMTVIGLSGKDGGKIGSLADIPIIVPVDDVARIQEVHLAVLHTIASAVDLHAATDLIPTHEGEQLWRQKWH